MRHRHRPPTADLLAEQRHHRSGGAQHVTEADHGENRAAAPPRHGLQDQFGKALGGAHHIGGAHRLVGGNQDEVADAGGFRALGRGQRAQNIVAHASGGVLLNDGDVFIGGGVIQRIHVEFAA